MHVHTHKSDSQMCQNLNMNSEKGVYECLL